MKKLDEIIGIKTKHRIQLTTDEIKQMLIEASEQAFNAAKEVNIILNSRNQSVAREVFTTFERYEKEIT